MTNFADQIAAATKALRKELADIGGANSREMQAGGRALAREIRKTIGIKGTPIAGPLRPGKERKGLPAAKGEAPRRQTARLRKSIGLQVVGGVLRVGSSRFTSRILDEKDHPFMAQSLERALPAMEGDFVGELQKKGGG